MFNVFESPLLLSLTAVVSVIVIWVMRVARPDKIGWRYSMIPILIMAAAFSLDFFVKTDREKINSALNIAIKAFTLKQIEPISEIVAADYSDPANSSKMMILAYCKALFEIAPVEKISLLSKNLKINGSKAVLTSDAMVKFAPESEITKMGQSLMLVKFRLYFRKTAQKQWLVHSSNILEIDRKAVNWGQVRNF